MAGKIEGTVVFKDNMSPVADARVFLDPEAREPRSTKTDGLGHFEFENVVTGLHELVADREGYQRKRQDVTVYHEQTVYPIVELEKGGPKVKKGKTKGTFDYSDSKR